ncbi:MAG: sulfite exporter TauE/SafE family protein, partial [Rhodobacterales bacterium]|nr:sulfite exporter TauE/SafE family protein [Rhodobacterales bacterium]
MVLDLTFFAFAIPAVLFAGVSKGGFGSGAAFAASPFLALILEPAAAIGLMLPLLMVMDVTALRPFWKRWNWGLARQMMLGAVPGVCLGAALYTVANADVLRFLIGSVAVGFVLYQLARARGLLRL